MQGPTSVGSWGLPSCHFEIKAKEPVSGAFPKRLATLGDHPRKRRLELNLTQSEAAAAMGVDEMTVVGWELNQHQPLARYIPEVIKFLGYVPEDLFPNDTTVQKIKGYRLLHGMTRKELAKKLRMDQETLRRLETKTGKHPAGTLIKISLLIDVSGSCRK